MSEQDIPRQEPVQSNCKLYVTNLDSTFSNRKIESDLKGLFDKFGSILSISVRRNEKSNRVFAFVLYKNSQQAKQAIQNLDGEYLGDMRLKVEFQRERREPPIRDTRQAGTLTCYRCGKPGHFARFCTEKISNKNSNQDKEHVDRERKDSRRKGRSRQRKRRESSSSSGSSSSSSSSRGKSMSDAGRGRRRRSESSSSSSGSE